MFSNRFFLRVSDIKRQAGRKVVTPTKAKTISKYFPPSFMPL